MFSKSELVRMSHYSRYHALWSGIISVPMVLTQVIGWIHSAIFGDPKLEVRPGFSEVEEMLLREIRGDMMETATMLIFFFFLANALILYLTKEALSPTEQ